MESSPTYERERDLAELAVMWTSAMAEHEAGDDDATRRERDRRSHMTQWGCAYARAQGWDDSKFPAGLAVWALVDRRGINQTTVRQAWKHHVDADQPAWMQREPMLTFRAWCQWLMSGGYLTEDPTDALPLPPPSHNRGQGSHVSADEFDRMYRDPTAADLGVAAVSALDDVARFGRWLKRRRQRKANGNSDT